MKVEDKLVKTFDQSSIKKRPLEHPQVSTIYSKVAWVFQDLIISPSTLHL